MSVALNRNDRNEHSSTATPQGLSGNLLSGHGDVLLCCSSSIEPGSLDRCANCAGCGFRKGATTREGSLSYRDLCRSDGAVRRRAHSGRSVLRPGFPRAGTKRAKEVCSHPAEEFQCGVVLRVLSAGEVSES